MVGFCDCIGNVLFVPFQCLFSYWTDHFHCIVVVGEAATEVARESNKQQLDLTIHTLYTSQSSKIMARSNLFEGEPLFVTNLIYVQYCKTCIHVKLLIIVI